MKFSKRTWTIAAVGVLLLGIAAYSIRRPVGYFVFFHIGRSQACTWADIQRTLGQEPGQTETRIAASSRRVRTDLDGYELWNTPKGDFWIPPENGEKFPWLLSNIERHIDRLGPCQVRAEDIVFDCGAHVGLFTREALSSGAKLVVAIEPMPENLECLKRNFAEEIGAGRVIVFPKGVWDREEILSFKIAPRFSASDRVVLDLPRDAKVQRVPVTTIDRLVAELGLKRVDFIKLHVEGSEQQALMGARETLAGFRPRLAIAANHRDDDAERIPELVRAAWPGYQMKCGDCYLNRERLLILPEILFFFE
jgi:FkbM family methyltransferase